MVGRCYFGETGTGYDASACMQICIRFCKDLGTSIIYIIVQNFVMQQ